MVWIADCALKINSCFSGIQSHLRYTVNYNTLVCYKSAGKRKNENNFINAPDSFKLATQLNIALFL